MIDFSLTDDERMAQELARRFAAERLRPAQREHERAGVTDGVRRAFAGTGLGAIDLPEPHGAGLGALAGALVREELACGDAAALLALDEPGPAGRFLAELLPARDAAAVLGAHRRLALHVDWEDTGARALPFWPGPADAVIVAAPGRVTLHREVRAEPVEALALQAAGPARLSWSDAGEALPAGGLDAALGAAWAYLASVLVGVARGSAEYARGYALERVAFGRPIAHHQALAFLLVDMAIAVDAARLSVWRAAADPARGADAFLQASEAALWACERGVQVLGGHGFLCDHPAEKWMREARALSLCCGGQDAAAHAAGEQVLP